MNEPDVRERRPDAGPAEREGHDLALLLAEVAMGDHQAFEVVYGQLAGPVYGVVRRVLRDPHQSEEVAQEVLLEIWQTASRFDSARAARRPGR